MVQKHGQIRLVQKRGHIWTEKHEQNREGAETGNKVGSETRNEIGTETWSETGKHQEHKQVSQKEVNKERLKDWSLEQLMCNCTYICRCNDKNSAENLADSLNGEGIRQLGKENSKRPDGTCQRVNKAQERPYR